MFGQIYFRVLGIGCFLSMALLSSAQSKLDSLHHLNEVVVTARINKEVIPVQSLSGDKLEKLAAHSVADAIRYFSGVQIKDYGGIGGLKTVNIRSMGTNHVGVFYDGIELGNAQNGVIDLGRFSLDNMEAVTLYNGQKSAIFQPAKDFGSAGSIYLQSRTPVFREDRAYHVKATFKTGSFGVVNPSLLWEQKLSENVSASLSTEYMYTTGKYKFTYAYAVMGMSMHCVLRAAYMARSKVVTGVRKLIFIIQNVDIPVLLCGIVSHMRIANGIQISFSNLLSKKISVMCTVCC